MLIDCLNLTPYQKFILDAIKRAERGEKISLLHRPRVNYRRFQINKER